MCPSAARVVGKTVVITGANAGIGKETARELVSRGARVTLACRDETKAHRAAEEIRKADPSRKDAVAVRKLDLADLSSVRRFAKEVTEAEPKIDILINNAGVMACPKMRTKDGFEMQLGVNHLGHFLLTNLLLEKLKASAPSRILNVSSIAHVFGRIHFDDLQLEKRYHPMKAYNQSKLANVLFTRELSRRLKDSGAAVSVYALHPGVIQTGLWEHSADALPGILPFFLNKYREYFMKTQVEGAQTTIYCAVAEEIEKESGLYYNGYAAKKPSARARNDAAAKKLWDASCELVGLSTHKSESKRT